MADLTALTIAEIRDGLTARAFSASELVRAYLAAIEAARSLNAYIVETPEKALAMAAESDRRIGAGEARRLEGVPLGIKDLFCTEGIHSQAASHVLDGFKPVYESTVTANLWADGAIMLGKLNMDEFAMGSSNENSAYGPVLNPWDLGRTPGGSSGGSAAAVAARMAPCALGSDTGGSIRQPASLTGTVGVKPTYGRVSRYGLIAFASSLDQAGVFARTAADAATVLKAIAGFDPAAACGLSLVLVLMSLLVLGGETGARGRTRTNRSSRGAARAIPRVRLGRATLPVFFGLVALCGLALGVPIGTLVYWMVRGSSSTLPSASLASATWHTALYSACAAALATAAALPVALVAVRQRRRSTTLLERSTYIVQALPGLVIALALVFFVTRWALFLYQTPALLVIAYAILFFPLALVAVKASVARAPIGLEDVGRSLGRGPIEVLWRVTLPLVGPGLAAAFSLVFLSAVTELTATLILVPIGVHTLATQFWAYTTNLSYGAAAPYAALLVGIAALPTYVLGRWFERLPSRASS